MISFWQQKLTIAFKFYFGLGLISSLSMARLADEQNNVEIYQKYNPAVVNITAVTLTRDFFFEIVPQKGVGSGAVIRSDGYIVTNDHVVGSAQNVEVTFSDKSQFPAKVIGTDPDSDLTILKIEPQGKKLTVLDFGVSEGLAVGQKVLAIGNPFGLGGSLSVGVISSLGRDIRTQTDRLIKDIIQTDAAINPGNSGGPLMDSSGKLIGINAQIVSRSGGSEGIGFAINVKTVKKITEQLIQFGKILRPDLGVEGVGLSPSLFSSLGIPTPRGVMITEVVEKSAAKIVGLKSADKELVYGFRRIPIGGDVIYQIDEAPISSMRDIYDYLSEKKINDMVLVYFVRGSSKRTVRVKLQAE
ncbi:MAG: trypsin-like serine protease [Bdellovibrionales bacterium]|nr:trypsin-like serine protease [Bdellovibrionales bacterium]